MATQVGTPDVLPGVFPMASVALTMISPAATADFIEYPNTGNDMIIMVNGAGAPVTSKVLSGVDPLGRADSSSQSTAAVSVTVWQVLARDGWPQGGGNIRTQPGDTGMVVACLSLVKAK